MRVRVMGLAALLAMGTSACDPMWTMELRQSVNPVPSTDCLRRTVSSSRQAMITGEYGPRPEPEGFYVMFRGDSVPPYNRRSGHLTRETAPDSTGQLLFRYAGECRHHAKTASERGTSDSRPVMPWVEKIWGLRPKLSFRARNE